MRRRPPTKLQSLKHLRDGLISVPCRSPSAFISLSRSRPNVVGPTTGDEGDHHAANGIIGACGFEGVLALDPAPRAWRVGAVRRVPARDRGRQRPNSLMKNLKSSAFVLRFSSSYKRSVRFGSEWSRLVATLPYSEPTRS